MKILYLGNSITWHDINREIGWPGKHGESAMPEIVKNEFASAPEIK